MGKIVLVHTDGEVARGGGGGVGAGGDGGLGRWE